MVRAFPLVSPSPLEKGGKRDLNLQTSIKTPASRLQHQEPSYQHVIKFALLSSIIPVNSLSCLSQNSDFAGIMEGVQKKRKPSHLLHADLRKRSRLD